MCAYVLPVLLYYTAELCQVIIAGSIHLLEDIQFGSYHIYT